MNRLLGLAVVLALAFGVPSSAAALPGEESKVPDSVVETVTTTVEGVVPDPPAVKPPPVPAAPPSEPAEVPADPPSQPAEPTAAAPDPVSNLSHGVSKVVQDVSPPASEAVEGVAREAASASQTPGGDVQPAEDSGASTGDAPEFTPVSWFMIHVWPAVAIERGWGPGAALGGTNFPLTGDPGASPLARFAAALFPGLKESRPVSADLPPTASPPAADKSRSPTAPWESALSSGARIALYIAIAALLTLLAYMVRTELSSLPGRPGHH
jgi:hypothetical protein